MGANTFGRYFRLTTYGESHGVAVGGIIDGCPAGLQVDMDYLQQQMARRRPGQSAITTQRKEADQIELLSGVFGGKTLGTPIAFEVRNQDQRSGDYDSYKDLYRPSHADYTYEVKYGHRDYRGSGRTSARETLSRVAGGAIARLLLHRHGIEILAYTSSVGSIEAANIPEKLSQQEVDSNPVRCPDEKAAKQMISHIEKLKQEGDSTGGVVRCVLRNVPPGLGGPVFHKLQADLAAAMLSINASKGFEYGSGFAGTQMRGSQHNDLFYYDPKSKAPRTRTNHSGGIQGGISNGEDICFSVAFKPVSTIMIPQQTLDTDMNAVETKPAGRHDPCVVPRAVPVVEAMAALCLADALLASATSKL